MLYSCLVIFVMFSAPTGAEGADVFTVNMIRDVFGIVSAPSLLGWGFWMVMTDRLVPGRRVAKIEQEGAFWRKVAIELLGQNGDLMTTTRVAGRMFAAVADQTQEADG